MRATSDRVRGGVAVGARAEQNDAFGIERPCDIPGILADIPVRCHVGRIPHPWRLLNNGRGKCRGKQTVGLDTGSACSLRVPAGDGRLQNPGTRLGPAVLRRFNEREVRQEARPGAG